MADDAIENPTSPAAVRRRGIRDCFAAPGLGMAATMIGFGSLAHEAGMSIWIALVATATVWGMAPQIAFVELFVAGGGIVATFLAVWLANARVLPLTIATIPRIRTGRKTRAVHYFYGQLLSTTSLLQLMRVEADFDADGRRNYFLGFTLTSFILSLVGTAVGFVAASELPPLGVRALVLIAPLYMLLLSAGVERLPFKLAVVIGGVLLPMAHLLSPDWGLLVGGVGGGTLAFLIGRVVERRHD